MIHDNFTMLQAKVVSWFHECFKGYLEIQADPRVRMMRLLEEINELAQSTGISREDAHKAVDAVYDRPPGPIKDEIGGAGFALLVYCGVSGYNLLECIEAELDKNWKRIPKIRARQATKPIPTGMDASKFVIAP